MGRPSPRRDPPRESKDRWSVVCRPRGRVRAWALSRKDAPLLFMVHVAAAIAADVPVAANLKPGTEFRDCSECPETVESCYEGCLCLELEDARIPFQSQVVVPVIYKGRAVPMGFRADILVAGSIIVEIKAVASLLPAHQTQLLTYLRLSQIRIGLLMNFHARRLKDGQPRCIV